MSKQSYEHIQMVRKDGNIFKYLLSRWVALKQFLKLPALQRKKCGYNCLCWPTIWQLSAAGGIAAGGAPLDIDDVAGELDQDRGEGRAPFPEDSLPDGGGGGSARVVPRHPEGN